MRLPFTVDHCRSLPFLCKPRVLLTTLLLLYSQVNGEMVLLTFGPESVMRKAPKLRDARNELVVMPYGLSGENVLKVASFFDDGDFRPFKKRCLIFGGHEFVERLPSMQIDDPVRAS